MKNSATFDTRRLASAIASPSRPLRDFACCPYRPLRNTPPNPTMAARMCSTSTNLYVPLLMSAKTTTRASPRSTSSSVGSLGRDASADVLQRGAVRLVVARCSVEYEGRLGARLPPAQRLILLKADGSIAVHADAKAYKPLNWMSPPCTIREESGAILATN